MNIVSINSKDNLWDKLIDYANFCNWKAWPILAQKMNENKFLDWERIFVATENDEIIWFCTFTKEDWIPDCDYSPFVWFMFVDENYRWKRISEQMINEVEKYAKTLNFEKLYIVRSQMIIWKILIWKMWWKNGWIRSYGNCIF